MPETLTAQCLSGNYSFTMETKTRPLINSGIETKSLVEGELGGYPVFLVERFYDHPEDIISKWNRLKKVGIPVVPVMMKSSRNTLLVADFKADGSEIYGKNFANLTDVYKYETRERPNPQVDKIFLGLTEDSLAEIERQAREYVEIANRNKITLPIDDSFELVVNPDGKWQIMLLDLLSVDVDTPMSDGFIADCNKSCTDRFIGDLKSIRDTLLSFDPHA